MKSDKQQVEPGAIRSFATMILATTVACLAPALQPEACAADAAAGSTRILKWKDGKKAAFMLGFDDSAASQLKNVVPELEKRKIVGTFYLVTGNSLYAKLKPQWEAAARSPYVEIANHTFTHKGVNDAAELEPELAKCNEVIYALHPERKKPRLIGFGKPGGVPWKVTAMEVREALERHHLCDRLPFAGPPINYKSAAECVAMIDHTIKKGETGQLVFHGVGGDWLVTPVEWFAAILDKLESVRDQLWITDVVSWHQYRIESGGVQVKSELSGKDTITVEFSHLPDPTFYDLPLTLATTVPAEWKSCTVTQGARSSTVPAVAGEVKYDALPGGGTVQLKTTP